MSRSVGAVALARTGKTQSELGRLIGVSSVSVHYWTSGEKKPGAKYRAKLLELFAIPKESWDERPTKKVAAKVVTAPGATLALPDAEAPSLGAISAGEETAHGMANELAKFAREELNRLNDRDESGELKSTPLERSRVGASIATTLEKIAKMTGEHDLGRKVLKLPLFKRAVTEIGTALKPWPDAARAVAERLETLERETAS